MKFGWKSIASIVGACLLGAAFAVAQFLLK
jgi:hypothetical protein